MEERPTGATHYFRVPNATCLILCNGQRQARTPLSSIAPVPRSMGRRKGKGKRGAGSGAAVRTVRRDTGRGRGRRDWLNRTFLGCSFFSLVCFYCCHCPCHCRGHSSSMSSFKMLSFWLLNVNHKITIMNTAIVNI